MSDISNTADIIDSRDVIERIQELEGERDSFTRECEQCEGSGSVEKTTADNDSPVEVECPLCSGDGTVTDAEAWAAGNESDAEELKELLELQEQCEGYADDWQHGTQLIRDSYFGEYAEELADDIVEGYRSHSATWPFTCIDWGRAADELKHDYTPVEYGDVTYYVR